MIKSISIANTATFGDTPDVLNNLKKINYIFGSNATGKTTISRIIANENEYTDCGVKWKGSTKLKTMVYNRDFVSRNFNQSSDIPGVFTMGESDIDTLNKLKNAKEELNSITREIEGFRISLEGKDGNSGKVKEREELEDNLNAKCWLVKGKLDEKFRKVFDRYHKSKVKFKDSVLRELTSNNAELIPLELLEEKSKTVYDKSLTKEDKIPNIEFVNLLDLELNPILKKRVIGKEDVDITAMIKKLGNSDWVRQGKAFYEINDMVCPFCQQKTTESFANSLDEYFDEAFEIDNKEIDKLIYDYKTESDKLQNQLSEMIAKPFKYLDINNIKADNDLLKSRLDLNKKKLEEKKREPSRIVELETIGDVVNDIQTLIKEANNRITENNKTVDNLSQERKNLTAQVWKYLLEKELKVFLENYRKNRDDLDKAIESLKQKTEEYQEKKKIKEDEIIALEKQTTSIKPTIDAINSILSSFGFNDFSIAMAGKNAYKLIREDGSDAKETLSEGERGFLTFLYFYNLIRGSDSESGITSDRVIVFDDPVSSLDSDILFVVSSLIKGLFDEDENNSGNIKQLFVLTHNIYFHRDVTFNTKRPNKNKFKDETFWIVRKKEGVSKLQYYDYNPIKSSYELLWSEVKNPNRSNLTIQNTLRRILENYFKILGNVDPDDIYSKFDGGKKHICKSLFAWVNTGSHYCFDDADISLDDSLVNVYLTVFKEIFDKTKNTAHYNMMMGYPLINENQPEGDER